MSEVQKEITHRNVLKLVEAHRNERERIDTLQRRVSELENQVRSLTIRMQEAERKSNAAFAVAQQARV